MASTNGDALNKAVVTLTKERDELVEALRRAEEMWRQRSLRPLDLRGSARRIEIATLEARIASLERRIPQAKVALIPGSPPTSKSG